MFQDSNSRMFRGLLTLGAVVAAGSCASAFVATGPSTSSRPSRHTTSGPTPSLRTASAATAEGAWGSSVSLVAFASAAVLLAAGRAQASTTTRRARSAKPSEPGADVQPISGRGRFKAFRGKKQVREQISRRTKKVIDYTMHVQPGDVVQVMKGRDAGLVTQVIDTYPAWNQVLCLNANFKVKHVRATRPDDEGQRVRVEHPFHAANVMHYSEDKEVASFLGMRYEEIDGEIKKVRYLKATGEEVPDRKAPVWTPLDERDDDDFDEDDEEE